MIQNMKIADKTVEVRKINVVFASENIIEDWLDDNKKSSRYLFFNEIQETFGINPLKNYYDYIVKISESIGGSLSFIKIFEKIKNIVEINELVPLIDELNKFSDKTKLEDGEIKLSNIKKEEIKRYHILNIKRILNLYRKNVENKHGAFDQSKLDRSKHLKIEYENRLRLFCENLLQIIKKIAKNTDFYDYQDPDYYENSIPVLINLIEIFIEIEIKIEKLKENIDESNDFEDIEFLSDVIKESNVKIKNIIENQEIIQKKKGSDIKSLGSFFKDTFQLDKYHLEEHPEILDLKQKQTIEDTLKLLLNQFLQIKKYSSLILQKIQIQTKKLIEKSELKDAMKNNIDPNLSFIDIINSPFQDHEKLKVFLLNLSKFEQIVKAVQHYHYQIHKLVHEFNKTQSGIIMLTAYYYDLYQTISEFEREKEKKIQFIQNLIANDELILQNEDKLLLLFQGTQEKNDLKNAFKKYYEELGSLDLELEQLNKYEENFNNLCKRIQEIQEIYSKTLSDEERINMNSESIVQQIKEFGQFFEQIAKIANESLKSMNYCVEFSFRIEKKDYTLIPLITVIVLRKDHEKWNIMDSDLLFSKYSLFREIILFAICLAICKYEDIKNKAIVFQFNSDLTEQEQKILPKMMNVLLNEDIIKDINCQLIVFFNSNIVFNLNNKNITIIKDLEDEE